MKYVEIKFEVFTDGDFDVKNDDNFFKKGFYTFKSLDIVPENKLEEKLILIFQEFTKRVYVKHNSFKTFEKDLKELTPFITMTNEIVNPIQELIQYGSSYTCYYNSNQEIDLNLNYYLNK